ncbi:PfkB family carbohydrate kinase [Hydrogenophaga sp. ANAO-22]|uniref:PfkB family carbohydrate kinase n=1 Tax=Hydrogenophaga sp. ANAO-22 TaxID=3166645 RepID=UPI0036D22B94
MTIHVVGGVYREYCVHPRWYDVFGSAGRAALAIATTGSPVVLHSYTVEATLGVISEKAAWLDCFEIASTPVKGEVSFKYLHDMAVPEVVGVPEVPHAPIRVTQQKVLRFGMLEGDAVVNANWAVYDPQNSRGATPFRANGSKAAHLALVLNSWEATQLTSMPGASPESIASILARQENAEVVVIKMGPRGAFVWTAAGTAQVPAYRTNRVWKIGSGDCFVAHFANAWMHDGLSPAEAADVASRATAYYCETRGFATKENLSACSFSPVALSVEYLAGRQPQVYLAGPFFDLMQIWMVEQAQANLQDLGLKVFSPYHDVGLGSADDVVAKDLAAIVESDIVFAITDGLDAGTVYEIGYARALGKPVVVYSERQHSEHLKMMEGSDCTICTDYTTALYSTLWEAVKL